MRVTNKRAAASSLLAVCLWLFQIHFNHCAAQNLSFGRQLLLTRGLQIQSLGFVSSTPEPPGNFALWSAANFTTFNSWNDDNSEKILGWTMPWSRWMQTNGSNPLTSNEKNQHLGEMVSLQYGDELNQDGTGTIDPVTTSYMAAAYASWHQQFGSNFFAYSNFGADNTSKTMTPAGISNYMLATQPDMLMFDSYPLQYVSFSTWYAEMQKYRLAGLAGNDGSGRQPIPYAQYLDLYRTSYNAALPDESFIRLQEFASWAFGYTFLTPFVYNQPNNPTVYPALFSSAGDGSPTAAYSEVAEANRESLNLGPALIRMTSTDIRMIPGTGNSLPSGISAWAPGAGNNNYITSITPEVSPGGTASASHNNVLIGYFNPLLSNNCAYPFADGVHFMIVNGAQSGSAANSAQWYHLIFNFGTSGFNALQLLSRDTGQIQFIPLASLGGAQYSLDWNLTGGTGDLFRFANSSVETRVNNTYLDGHGNIVLAGTNFLGMNGSPYSILTSTNPTLPLQLWTTNTSGIFGALGVFSNTLPLNGSVRQQFFLLQTP
jgi:hypothetical protein